MYFFSGGGLIGEFWTILGEMQESFYSVSFMGVGIHILDVNSVTSPEMTVKQSIFGLAVKQSWQTCKGRF